MLKFIASHLQAKLTLAFIAVLLIPTVIIAAYTLNTSANTLVSVAKNSELSSLQEKSENLQAELEDQRADTVFLSQSPTIVDYVNELVRGPSADQITNVQRFFFSFLANTSHVYKDVRIVRGDGQELIRVDDANAQPQIISGSALANESQENYFWQTITLQSGQVYSSGFDLSSTQGKIDQPYLPILGYATPLIASDGTTVGILVLNAFGQPLIDDLKSTDPADTTYLINTDGSYLSGADPDKLYSNVLHTGHSFYKDVPNDTLIMRTQSNGNLFESQDAPSYLQTYVHVQPADQVDLQWLIVNRRPVDGILAQVDNARLVIILLSALAVLLAAAVAIIIARSIVRPLTHLSSAMEAISLGKWDAPLPKVKSRDEIGRLTATFDKMATDLNAAYSTLRQRTIELETANRIAREANRLKSEFLSTMSHELRTPLNAIVGFTDLLLTGRPGPINDTQRSFLERTAGNNKRLLKLINDILDLARIEAGRTDIRLAPYSPQEMLEHIAAQTSSLFGPKNLAFGMTIDLSLPAAIMGDRDRVEQIVVNLLSNAAKFTEQGEVRLTAKRLNDEQWSIAVKDTGPGIAPHMQEIIFDAFRQIDGTTSRQHGGSGLGLAIARELCQMMDGTLLVDSETGQGSTFTITLPIGVVPSQQTVADQEPMTT